MSILLMAMNADGKTKNRIGSIVESPEDYALVMRYDDKVPFKGRMRIHPASLVECLERGVERIEIKVKGDGWIWTTPDNALENSDIKWSLDFPMWEFYLPLPKWDKGLSLTPVFVKRNDAEIVWLEPISAKEVKALYLEEETEEMEKQLGLL